MRIVCLALMALSITACSDMNSDAAIEFSPADEAIMTDLMNLKTPRLKDCMVGTQDAILFAEASGINPKRIAPEKHNVLLMTEAISRKTEKPAEYKRLKPQSSFPDKWSADPALTQNQEKILADCAKVMSRLNKKHTPKAKK